MSINTAIEDGVARIIMDDGKVNALCAVRLKALSAALKEAREANAVVVIEGRAGVFSAGFDMKTFARGPEASIEMVKAGIAAIADILAYPRPVITFCAGHAYPMGAFLMLAADVRIGVTGDFRIGMNEPAIAIDVPAFALALARSRLAPPAFAAIRVARMFEPEEAVSAGYLDYAINVSEAGATLEREIAAAKALDLEAFQSTKLRMNKCVIDAVTSAPLPPQLGG